MNYIAYGAKYLLENLLFHKNNPLICGLVLTNGCNLQCRHCRIPGRKEKKLSFDDVKSAVKAFYEEGGRTIYLQGGEPFIWRDNDYDLENIVQFSRKTGFLSTIIYTNGTFPLNTSADTVFISLDGCRETHNHIRGNVFDRVIDNIMNSNHPSLYINYTINNYNKGDIEEFCKFIKNIKQIKGIFFYFHTPYYGIDDLYIEPDERNLILHKLIKLKKSYSILNSISGLKCAIRNDWKRPLSICRVFEDGKTYQCCRYPDNPELCKNCGYLSYAEIDQALKLKPSAILNAMKYF